MSRHKTYLLDTNICIFYMKNMFGVPERIREAGIDNCYISEISFAELYYGASNSGQKEKKIKEVEKLRNIFEALPIKPCLEAYGDAKAILKHKGLPIDDFDLFIGVTAIVNDMIMVTENVKHLSRINGISIENWVTR